VLVGSEYWSGLLSWIRQSVLGGGKISAGDEDLVAVVDDPAEAISIIQRAHAQRNGADPAPGVS
jgi:predicted Rossmann-fold nucleotide-binding protein